MKRHGFTFVEIFAALAVLAACALLFAQLVSLTTSERIGERTRRTAVDQMQNVLERLVAVPPEKLAAGDFDKAAAEALIERSLPEGKIVFDAKKFEPGGVVLTVTVFWDGGEISMFRLLTLAPIVPAP